MIAPKSPKGLKDAVGDTMHIFLMSQLEQICENDEEAPISENCFSKVMEVLYQRGINQKYTAYYEQLFDISKHTQEQRMKIEGKYKNTTE